MLGIQPDTSDLTEELAYMVAAVHRTIRVKSLVFDVQRIAAYGGKAIFSILDSSGVPIGPGPQVAFAPDDKEVVVQWTAYQNYLRSVPCTLNLRYHPGSPEGEMRIELRPSASDVQVRKDVTREAGEDNLTLAWDAVPPGRYEVIWSRVKNRLRLWAMLK